MSRITRCRWASRSLGLIDPAAFVQFWRLSRVATVTAASGLVFGLLPAVLVGVLLTLLLVLVELDRVGVTELEPTPGDRDVEPAGAHTEAVPGLLILRFDGPVYTANVRSANRKILTTVEQLPETWVVAIDGTALARASRLFPTALAAVGAFRKEPSGDPVL